MIDALAGGFADPVLDSQSVFRAVLHAMANPASIVELGMLAQPPAPLSPAAAAVALTLCDPDTPLWLDGQLARNDAVRAWIAFHCAAPLTSLPGEAAFALVSAGQAFPALDLFAQGSQEFPDRSTTLVIEVDALGSGENLQFEGPGIDGAAALAVAGIPRHFAAQWQANRDRFPRGVDLVLVASGRIACLPRTARLIGAEA
jgi:alpha-D-ribose 1-methylphosphonate 5-triphosphate synthase subunit PhnH